MESHSKACQCLPVVVAKDYAQKGEYVTMLGNMKVYITGPKDATKAVVSTYDAFGYSPQLLQGADMLATALNALVVVPDFFRGVNAKKEWIPIDNEEKKAAFTHWISTTGNFQANIEPLRKIVAETKAKYPSVGDNFGALGYCWGGKMMAITSGEDTPWKVSGQAHPGQLNAEEAKKITIPHIILASKDEPADVVAECKKILENKERKTAGVVETFGESMHGWMAARADLENEVELKNFQRGYEMVAEFFGKYL